MKNNIFWLSLAFWAFACAKQGTITGGPKDTTPPAMDTLRSSPNYITRFAERKIRLRFNEWVVLKDVTKEVVISPPPATFPKITLDNKTVVVDFGEKPELRPNTTYTIFFGGAVRDLHEGNPAKDLRYVFSTGDVIDSLSVEGIALDALTGAPIENASVMLYDVLEDSVILKEKPYYFGKTDKSGQFSIKNVRAGQFRCVAIEEGQSPNLKWNPASERIGFADSLAVLNDSLKRAALIFNLFKNEGPLRVTERSATAYGVARLIWSDLAPAVPVQVLPDTLGVRLLVERSKDTTWVWYDFPADRPAVAWSFLTLPGDTTRLRAFPRADFISRRRLSHAEVSSGGGRGRSSGTAAEVKPAVSLPPRIMTTPLSKPLRWGYNAPLAGIDTSRWVALVDSVPFRLFTAALDSTSPRQVVVSGQWKAGVSIRWQLLPGALTDFYGAQNLDTLQYTVQIATEKELGTLTLTAEGLEPGKAYVLELFNGPKKELERAFVAQKEKEKWVFKEMTPTAYTAQLIVDQNGNGRWDTGNYFQRRQPEGIINKKLDALKSNWELEASISAQKEVSKKRGEK